MRLKGLALIFVFFLTSCADTSYLPQFVTDTFEVSSNRDKQISTIDEPEYYEVAPENFKNAAVEVVAAEDLLDADGNWNVVEQGRAMDPAKAHLAARNRVNTKRRKRMADLTAHFEPDAKSGQDGTLRILKIEATEDIPEFDVAERNSEKIVPAAVDNLEDFGRNKSVFRGLKTLFRGKQDVPRPRRKPGSVLAVVSQKDVVVSANANTIITPPELPSFRKPPKLFAEKQKVQAPTSGVVIPKRKPVRLVSKKSGIEPLVVIQPAKKVEKRVVDTISPISKALKIRSGRHPGRTRLVLEVSDITKYKVAIDSIRNVLRIKMARTKWGMSSQGVLRGSKLFGTYIARELKDGSVLFEVRLSKKTKVLNTLVLPPNNAAKHRVVIDLDD